MWQVLQSVGDKIPQISLSRGVVLCLCTFHLVSNSIHWVVFIRTVIDCAEPDNKFDDPSDFDDNKVERPDQIGEPRRRKLSLRASVIGQPGILAGLYLFYGDLGVMVIKMLQFAHSANSLCVRCKFSYFCRQAPCRAEAVPLLPHFPPSSFHSVSRREVVGGDRTWV